MNEKNISTDASIYYKLKLFEDNDFVISAQPKILMSKSKKLKEDFLGEVSLLMGMSKNIRSVTIFNQNIFSLGHSINNLGSKKMYYNFSTCEGIKLKNGIIRKIKIQSLLKSVIFGIAVFQIRNIKYQV
nr:hypothetical protein [Rickettsia endosymbiont of Ixodes pacificus]